ncbi:Similar to KN motif and ankyrin repeat domain-containing protein 1; acc. no. Q14678 [Pyronema omphalodes CBS 100304]|uniref:Similar to KN motif and ankyrin repeat domain-containing protein 1 acc. no. Q14678 n=1 Tax=Pyronema omphalodes (strain CBS 100304) TaxID=1076935 RepID=U4L4T6_PYROM|nr:Similar to KN motif and ankyrin repeat domain-containing protein 1; acc. no. Q14678 [Pyronema omphalodes CBS 100304]
MCIAAFLDEDVVRRLLELRDIDINTQDNEGDTALMCAIHDGNPVQLVESVHLVLERHDIDVNLQSNDVIEFGLKEAREDEIWLSWIWDDGGFW